MFAYKLRRVNRSLWQASHRRPQRVIPSASEGPAFRPHRHVCSSPPQPPAACHPERQRGTCFSPAPPRLLKSTTTAHSVSSRAPARDLLFARTAATAQVHHRRPQRVIPSASEGPAFRPHRHVCSSPPPPPAACHPERQRGTCFSPTPPRLLKSTTTAHSVSSRAPARDLLFARTAATAQVHHRRPQRVIPSASEGPAFRPHRRDCSCPPPPPAACHPERQRGTCFSPTPPRLLKSTTAARSVSSRAPARDLLFARTTTADVIRDVNPPHHTKSS